MPHCTDGDWQIAQASGADVPDLLSSTGAANVAEMADIVAEVDENAD